MKSGASERPGYTRREFCRSTGGAALAVGALGFPAIVGPGSGIHKVIVLGVDGMDPGLLMSYVEAGLMPNCSRLMQSGAFSPLRTSDPPQSPVAWSNFIAGTNPGGHGIFDFIARDSETLKPYLPYEVVRKYDEFKDLAIGKGKMFDLKDEAIDLEDHTREHMEAVDTLGERVNEAMAYVEEAAGKDMDEAMDRADQAETTSRSTLISVTILALLARLAPW